MRKSTFLAGLLILLMGGAARSPAQAPAPAPPAQIKTCIDRANKAKISAYVMLLRLRWDLFAKWKETGVWSADAETDKVLDAHAEYWARQLKEGRAILAGGMNGDYWDNVAMIIFEATSQEEAETLARMIRR